MKLAEASGVAEAERMAAIDSDMPKKHLIELIVAVAMKAGAPLLMRPSSPNVKRKAAEEMSEKQTDGVRSRSAAVCMRAQEHATRITLQKGCQPEGEIIKEKAEKQHTQSRKEEPTFWVRQSHIPEERRYTRWGALFTKAEFIELYGNDKGAQSWLNQTVKDADGPPRKARRHLPT